MTWLVKRRPPAMPKAKSAKKAKVAPESASILLLLLTGEEGIEESAEGKGSPCTGAGLARKSG